MAEVALPLVLGIDAFGHGEYEKVVQHMEPIVDEIVRVGGSQAQRMVFEETLLRACMLAGQYGKAESMLRKRLEHRHSGRDFYWLAEVQTARGNHDDVLGHLDRGTMYWNNADADGPDFRRVGSLPDR